VWVTTTELSVTSSSRLKSRESALTAGSSSYGSRSRPRAAGGRSESSEDNYSEVEVPCPRAAICYEFRMCECSEDTCVARDFQQIYFRMTSEGGQMSGDARFTSEPVYHEIDFD